jgi:hypothetical protein
MAKPKTGGRAAAVVMVEFDPVGAAGVYTNWCGAKNFSLTVDNEIQSEKVGDCDDWSAPITSQKEYAGQDVSASMDATWTSATHKQTADWALDQMKLNVRVHFPDAIAGEIEYYDGVCLLKGLTLAEIGNVEGNKITENVTLEYDDGIERTLKV